MGNVVDGLEGHTSGHGAVANYCNTATSGLFILWLVDSRADGHAQGGA